MPRDGRKTKEKILEATQELVLGKGFAGTSIDDILAATGLTKGTFFYHFGSKAELAMALVQRFWENDGGIIRGLMERAQTLSDDPLQQYLIFLKLLQESFEASSEGTIGCLFATYIYEVQQFDPKVNTYVRQSLSEWQQIFEEVLGRVFENHQPAVEISKETLAETMLAVTEGAFVLAKSHNDFSVLARQVEQHRNYVKLLFGA